MNIESETAAAYGPSDDGEALVCRALSYLESKLRLPNTYITSPESATSFLRLKLADKPTEIFAALWLDQRHGVLAYEELFSGTIDGSAVYPRVVVSHALANNAAAVVFAHNHPSGQPEPSQADVRITQRLKEALALVDVRVLDHVVVGFQSTVSLAERGEI